MQPRVDYHYAEFPAITTIIQTMRSKGYSSLLTGLLFFLFTTVFAQTSPDTLAFNVSSFVINGDNPLGEQAQTVLRPYLGEHSGLDGLAAAADALERAVIGAGYSFHRVSLPPQALDSGRVELSIQRFTIGAIDISGNEFFDRENIERSLPQLEAGGTPNTKELSRSLKLANNHASKNMVLRFKEGEGEGDTIDAEITVKDQDPNLFFVTLDNTGSEETEEFRSTLGYQHGNLFNRDHAVTATLTVAPEDPDATTQIGVSYHIPFYGHGGNLDFLLSDSEVNSGEVGSGIEITGEGTVFGVSYSRPFLSDSNFNHQWSAGLQAKSFQNQQQAGTSQDETDVLSLPLLLGYSFTYSMQSAAFSGGFSLASNIEAGSNNTDEDYATVRTCADTGWSALRFNLAYDRLFAGNWMFHLGLSGQNSSDLLIPGEQYGVGGSGTLRGAEERSVTGDSGHQISVELWTPAYAGSRFLLFVDAASVEFNNTPGFAGSGQSFDLSSAGLGWRWTWKQQLSVSLDYGVILEGLEPDEGVNAGASDPINLDDDSRAHFNLVYRF
jgi:hemolysin activation/secretion protein